MRRIPNRHQHCYEFAFFAVVDYAGKFSIKLFEHFCSVLPVKRKKDLTVAVAFKTVSFFYEFIFLLSETVQLTVTYNVTAVQFKRLHSFRSKTHY